MATNPVLWTIRDLDAIPDDGWNRYEIIQGELLVTRAPHIRHQGSGGNVHFELEIWSRRTKLGKPFQTPGVIFTEVDAVIPDLVWASNERIEQGVDEAGHFVVAPELIVEVLSTGSKNEYRDTELKLGLYSLHGVQEYWIVNWRKQQIEVYRRHENRLQKALTLLTVDKLTSPLLPGFECAVSNLFTL